MTGVVPDDPRSLAPTRTAACCGRRSLATRHAPSSCPNHFGVLREAVLVLTRTEGTRCFSTVREVELERRFPGLLGLVMSEKPKKAGKKAAGKRI